MWLKEVSEIKHTSTITITNHSKSQPQCTVQANILLNKLSKQKQQPEIKMLIKYSSLQKITRASNHSSRDWERDICPPIMLNSTCWNLRVTLNSRPPRKDWLCSTFSQFQIPDRQDYQKLGEMTKNSSSWILATTIVIVKFLFEPKQS